jgi:sugar lactone lactonase YvrE
VVACFDARELFVIDLITMLPRSVVPNLSGPYEIALDEQRQLLYVADFRSSVIRIVDLSPIAAGDGEAPVQVVATLGEPQVLQELK